MVPRFPARRCNRPSALECTQMTSRERIETVIAGGTPDRTPVLGGWIAVPAYIQELAGVSEAVYWDDPQAASIRAYHKLGTDGLLDLFVPLRNDGYRCVDADSFRQESSRLPLEAALAEIDAMPSPEQVEAGFRFDEEYASFRDELVRAQAAAGDMVWMPAQWGAGAGASWYQSLGYENYFCVIGLYEQRARKLMELGGVWGRCRSRLIARAVREGIYPGAVLLGEDICTQKGPMISPAFLERYYAPELRRGLEPLFEAGCRPVWHSDGDVRPLLDMLLDCGVQGFQGFQPECGLTVEAMARRRTRDGKPLLIYGPLSVTTELPVLSPGEVRERVYRAIDVCRGNADLMLFVANTINPDVPLDNVRAMYEAVHNP